MSESATEQAANVVVDWALEQIRMRSIVGRPFGIFDGQVQGDLLYHDPGAVQPPLPTAAPAGS